MNNFGGIRQVAYLVEDIEAAMDSWIKKAGLGPFVWYKNLTLQMDYKGVPSEALLQVAIAYRGNLQIELIQQCNDAPSPYRDFFLNKRMGLHHLAYVTGDISASLEQAKKQGYEVIATINQTVGNYAYFQDPAMPEVFYEFLELSPGIEAYWQDCIEKTRIWDGSNPVTIFDMSGM